MMITFLTPTPPKLNSKNYNDGFNYNAYCEFGNGYKITLMKQLDDNDVATHIREITNNVARVNLEIISSYKRQ